MAEARSLIWAGVISLAAVRLDGMQAKMPDPLNAALVLYRQNHLAAALPLFVQAAAADSTNPTTLAWLAETLRRLEKGDSAVAVARRALALSPCHAFAHTVMGAAYNPWYRMGLDNYDSTWVHLRRAVECDPNDGNAWLNLWGEALRRGDRRLETQSLRRLVETRFLSRTALSYDRWLLRDLPPNTVLVASGDLDTYPALALQVVERLRPDVVVVNSGMLHLWWYVQEVHAKYGLPFPGDSATLAARPICGSGGADTVCLGDLVLQEWRRLAAEEKLTRPLVVEWDSMLPQGPGVLVRIGPVAMLRSRSESLVDTAAVWRSLRGIDGTDFADPIVTPNDRGAIRIASAAEQGLQLHVAWTAVVYGGALMQGGRVRDARDLLEWLRRFVRDSRLEVSQARTLVDDYAHDVEAAERKP